MAGGGLRGDILVINAGSSSIKFAVFDADLQEKHSGLADGIGGHSALTINGVKTTPALENHHSAQAAILGALAGLGITPHTLRAAAHRVVHGGESLTRPAKITAEILEQIAACAPLAPLHNPHNLAAILALADIAPGLAQFVSFDTSFHATNPDVATRYAIPRAFESEGIRRYGFHGISYASLTQNLPALTGGPLPARLLAFHLGNGASLCAIRDGKSIATTMGYSPLDGLTMGTRAGGIDANAVLRLAELHGIETIKTMLNNQSGLAGLSGGKSDMRNLMQDHGRDSAFAIRHFIYWSLRHAGSLIAAMQGVDAIAFTGGIGENSPDIRAGILTGLAWLGLEFDPAANAQNRTRLHRENSAIETWIIPAREERKIAADALDLISRPPA
jgi:acetate kinase